MLVLLLSLCLLGGLAQADCALAGDAGGALPRMALQHGRPCQDPASAWLRRLPPAQRCKAQAVLDAYAPQVQDLRRRIALKKNELMLLSYSQSTEPDSLSRMGQELQQLRDELRALLLRVRESLSAEVGAPLEHPRSHGCGMALFPRPGD